MVKGAWSLVSAIDNMTREQRNLDKRVEALVDAMNAGSELAKEHIPVKGRYASKDSVFRDMLKEIIKGTHMVKVWCEKRPEGVCGVKRLSFYKLMMSLYPTRPFDREDDSLRPC